MGYNPKIRPVNRRENRYRWYGGGFVLRFAGAPEVITVREVDGAPSFSSITTLEFDQGDGFTVSQPVAGVARIDFTPTAGLGDPGGNGIVIRTAPNTTINRSLVAPAAGISISNADGVAGNPTFALANDLAALEALGNGIPARTAADTWASRTMTGTANRIVITNGDGVSGNPTFDIGSDVVTLTGSQTLTNKTLTTPIINVGSDAQGDVYFRNGAGAFTRLPIGTAGQVLTVNAGATAPEWAAGGGGGGLGDPGGNGIVVRTALNTTIARTITGTANRIVVTDGNGVSANPSIDIGSDVVTPTSTHTLSNKTLTAPRFADLGFIADDNGNELIIFDRVASAINEITVANAASGNRPSIVASGATDVGLIVGSKGAGELVLQVGGLDCLRLDQTGGTRRIGFLNSAPVAKQTSGADLTNNVTSGGFDNVIANYTDLSTYSNDATEIRNNFYQLARKLKQVNDALRLYGLLT